VICDMSASLDGYVTGPNDSREKPFGGGGPVGDTSRHFRSGWSTRSACT
jgi:hypothetical protein